MNLFELIPNKQPLEVLSTQKDFWPELGQKFELNEFYREFCSAEGWIGETYLIIWKISEILEFREASIDFYPEKYTFFASNGGGTQFGFVVNDGKVDFISAPDIGDESDIRILGGWSDFLKSLQLGDYI